MIYDTMVFETFKERVLKKYPSAKVEIIPHKNGYIQTLNVLAVVNDKPLQAYCECGGMNDFRAAFKYVFDNFKIDA